MIEGRIELLKNKTKNILQDFQMNIFKEISKINLELVENFISHTFSLTNIVHMRITVG